MATVFVPVTDQDRALEFYVDKLGFEKRADFRYGRQSRWVEVAPRGSANALALVPPDEGRAPAREDARCAFVTDDIDADHAAMQASGIDVDPQIAGKGSSRAGLVSTDATVPDPVPAQFLFRDPDGNRFLIVQPG